MATLVTARNELRRIADAGGDTLAACVAANALEYGDPLAFLFDVTTYGCEAGCVPGLLYYSDTRAFFDKHYAEIEELRNEAEASAGLPLQIYHDLKNDLAWFAFEETAFRLLDRLNAL